MNREITCFEDQVDELLERVLARIEREVPEEGDFNPVLELFNNLDEESQYYVGKYGMKVYSMGKSVDADQRKRYVEAAAYIPSGDYKADIVVCSGSKEDIVKKLQDPDFNRFLCRTYGELLEMIEEG